MKTAKDLISVHKQDLVTVSEDTCLADALELMLARGIGSILATREGEIVGIWTERDLMRNISRDHVDIATARVKDHMTDDLKSVDANDSVYHLMDKFLGLRLRHLLVVQDGQFIGMLSGGDVMKASIQEKNRELGELNSATSWEYYEEWKA